MTEHPKSEQMQAQQTKRFGLSRLTQVTDQLSDNDWKFGTIDRDTIDRLLAHVVEGHHHDASVAAVSTLAPLRVTASATGGVFPPGATVYYRYALVDALGNESVASDMALVALPAQVMIPSAPTVRAVVGSSALLPGPTTYAVAAVAGDGGTQCSPTVQLGVQVGQQLEITLPRADSGVSAFNVYRKGPTDGELQFWRQVDRSMLTVTDDGSIPLDPHRLAPTENTTNNHASVQVELPAALPAGSTWKLFRTTIPSEWTTSLVMWDVGNVVVDTGHALAPGSPRLTGTSVNGAPKIELATEAMGGLPPGQVVVPVDVVFRWDGPVSVGDIEPYVWVSDFDYAEVVSARLWLTQGSVAIGEPVEVTLDCRRVETGGWIEIFAFESSTAPFAFERAYVPLGETIGPVVAIDVPNASLGTSGRASFVAGDALRIRVTRGGTTTGLTMGVMLYVRHGSQVQSLEWGQS